MSTVKLNTLPVTIETDKLALGLLDMFDENELTCLRFGMLPAKKMELLEKQLEASFRERFASTQTGDQCYSAVETPDDYNIVEWSMKDLVREAMHQITLAIYSHGDLVV